MKRKKYSFKNTKLIFAGIAAIGLFAVLFNPLLLAQTPSLSSLFGNSYSPDSLIPKKIFARALAQYLNVRSGRSTNCYRDLDRNDEDTRFICALKRARVFKSASGGFRPNSDVNWDFAITSLCRGQNWVRNKNFSACKSFASRNGLIASSRIRPRNTVTFQELVDLMERARNIQPQRNTSAGSTTTTRNNAIPQNNPPATNSFSLEIPPRQQINVSSTPYPAQNINTNFFANIALNAPLPNRFYKDEVYFIEGDFMGGLSADQVFAFLCREGQGCNNSIDFLENTTGGTHFRIPVHFEEAGNFQLGIIPGRSGQSRVADISVLPEAPEPPGGIAPTNLSVGYNAGRTAFSWNGSGVFTRLIIFQGQERKDFLFRQNTTSYSPASENFVNFIPGNTGWTVKADSALSAPQQISIVTQNFRRVENDQIQVQQLQEVFSAPAQFTFRARSLSSVSKRAAITLPSGQVEDVIFSTNDLPAQNDFTINYNLTATGTYIFEVNNPEGGAIVNVPIYVGNSIPLIPDYFALNPPELNTTPISNLNNLRTQLLNLINQDRASMSLAPVSLNDQLNSVAQGHSQDMVTRNFFGHVNPSGIGPDGRRRNAGYNVNIKENLAKATTLELAEYGLMRSPIHRAVIIDPALTRVGLGIAKNTEGYFIITQNFSANPLTANDLSNTNTNLLNAANQRRTSNGLVPLSRDSTLQDITNTWSSRMANEGFFSVYDPSGERLIDVIHNRGINTSIQINIVQVSSVSQLEEEILRQTGLNESSNRKIGIGLTINSIGDIFMTVVYTP